MLRSTILSVLLAAALAAALPVLPSRILFARAPPQRSGVPQLKIDTRQGKWSVFPKVAPLPVPPPPPPPPARPPPGQWSAFPKVAPLPVPPPAPPPPAQPRPVQNHPPSALDTPGHPAPVRYYGEPDQAPAPQSKVAAVLSAIKRPFKKFGGRGRQKRGLGDEGELLARALVETLFDRMDSELDELD